MKALLALTLFGAAIAQADPETYFLGTSFEPSRYIGLVSKGDIGAFPLECTSITPLGFPYCDLDIGTGDLAPDGTVTLMVIYTDTPGEEFFGLFLGVEIGATGGFEGGSAVELTGFAISDVTAMTEPVGSFSPMLRYAPDGRLWTADYTECIDEDLTQFSWGTIDTTLDPAVFTGQFQVTSPDNADGGFYPFALAGFEFACPLVGFFIGDIANDAGFGIVGNYLYLNYAMEWFGFGFWAISLDTTGLYTRSLDNMIWAAFFTQLGLPILAVPGVAATDRGQGRFWVGSPTVPDGLFDIKIQTFDFSCYPPIDQTMDPTPITYALNDDLDVATWLLPVSAGREFYYCEWPEGVCEDGAINANFVVIGDGLVESVCASAPTGRCGYTWIGCAEGYVAHGFIPGKETCNRTASEIGWSLQSWSLSEELFECEFGAGGSTTECHEKCTFVAQSVAYRGTELQFQVSCYRCDDANLDLSLLETRDSRFTPVTDNTGFGAVVVAVGCAVGDLDCCNFVLNRAQCEAGIDLDLCFCGIDLIDCPNPVCNRSKKGLLGLLGLLGIIPLALCCLLLLLCFLRGKKRGAPVPVATFDACAPPVLDGCTAVPSFGACGPIGPSVGYPGTWVA